MRHYDDTHVGHKLAFLNLAMELYGITVPAFVEGTDHTKAIINTAKEIERYVFTNFEQGTKTAEQSLSKFGVGMTDNAEQRKAFLDGLESNSCGRGDHNCNGSEDTCTCQ